MEFSETDFGRYMAFLKMHPGQSLSAAVYFSWEITLKQPEAKQFKLTAGIRGTKTRNTWHV
jgi:hypothetical protein